ncbi:MAG: hypothetical protein ISS43_00600 [Candidatus Omnitrophica bacterium]|nr:hypothetical protein [Candidatus Omnitrophota bacterium]
MVYSEDARKEPKKKSRGTDKIGILSINRQPTIYLIPKNIIRWLKKLIMEKLAMKFLDILSETKYPTE